jgi:cytidyltransferase-like protein
MIACFSGRFDRPHTGHIVQIMRLGQEFDRVIVPVLDHPDQRYPVQYRVQVLQDILAMAKGNYFVYANKEHFGEIAKNQCPMFDVYISGNFKCLKHMESLGYKTRYLDRAYGYSATAEYESVHES